jgi:acetyl esterase/lipase
MTTTIAEHTPAEVIALWPAGPPTPLAGVGSEVECRMPYGAAAQTGVLRNVSEPTLSVFRPPGGKANGVGVIVCPGGGWRLIAWEHEGVEIARWLTGHGYTAFVLKYRVHGTPASPEGYEAWEAELAAGIDVSGRGRRAIRGLHEITPYKIFDAARAAMADDARRAVEIVRARSGEWALDPGKLGMMGFSAGGFVVTDVALDPRAAPLAFVAPIYGGEALDRPVPVDAPPLFTVVAQDDFHYRITEGLYADWTDADRPAEVHIFRRGGHGFGLSKQGAPSDRWIELFHVWLGDLGLG